MTKVRNNTILEHFKRKVRWTENDFIIGCFGFINANKRPEQILAAAENLVKKGYQIKVIFFGRLKYNGLARYIRNKTMHDSVVITDYLESDEYAAGLQLCDAVVNLRYPSMGESSATLSEALKYGRAVLVSENNQYLEYPDDVCWKIPVSEYEIPVLESMIEYLIRNPDVRKALGQNAQNYADAALSPDKIAKQYFEILQKIEKKVRI
jgi:glycosyltransferase involved in cell wall biosynthesis